MSEDRLQSFLIGTVLGDSSLCGRKNKFLFMGHCESQLNYLRWKVDFIKENLPIGITVKEGVNMSPFPGGKRQKFYKAYTTSHHKLTSVYNLIYQDKKKIRFEQIYL